MSLSDFSDLTDLSSDDDVPLSTRTSTSKVKKASKEYKISHVLRAPRTAQYTAKSLYDQIIDNSIDLDPEYQRDVVWQEEKQSGLIDSILRNYYIPPIIFAVTTQEDGSEMRTCIDGKQRLTSIQRFIDGHIPHKDSFTNEKLWFKSGPASARRKLLPQHLRTLFSNKQIVCIEYSGLNDDQEREIFQRVQLGVALTPAERLQALVGPWSTVIHEIQHQVLGEAGFEGYLDWGHTRGRDFQCLATIGYLIENHPKSATPGTKTLEKWLQKTQPVSNQLRSDLHETFRIFVTLARDKRYSGSLNRPTRVSPIEFVMIALLIYLKRQSLSLTQISSAIEKMRKDVRASHQDIRSNTRVTKHLIEFMEKKIKVSELKSDGEGDKPASVAVAKAAKPVKRKRPVHSDDSDSEPAPKVKPAKLVAKPKPTEAAKSSKEVSPSIGSVPKTNGTKKTAPVPGLPSKPPTSTRMTNNSLSSQVTRSSPKPPLLIPTTQKPAARSPSFVPHTTNGHDVPSGPLISKTTRESPLTVQTGPTIKRESPQMTLLNSPVTLPIADRLAPIRAAKATLASGAGTQSTSLNAGNEAKAVPTPSTNTLQTQITHPQNYGIPPVSSQHEPPPPPSLQPQSAGETAIPARVEEVLRTLRAQFPQLSQKRNETPNSEVLGANGLPVGTDDHSMRPPTPFLANNTGVNNLGQASQTYGMSTPQDGYRGGAQPNMDQTQRSYVSRWSSGPSIPGSGPPQQSAMSSSTSAGLQHSLPPRPTIVTNAPTSSMRAEPLGDPRSASSESTNLDGRRSSWSNDRRHTLDDRRSSTYDRNQDFSHGKRNWYHGRP